MGNKIANRKRICPLLGEMPVKTEIKYGTVIMHAETRARLGRVIRQSAHFYTYQKDPTATDCRKWARIRKDLAMPVQPESEPITVPSRVCEELYKGLIQ